MNIFSWLKVQALAAIDRFNSKNEPFQDFTRSIEQKPPFLTAQEEWLAHLAEFYRLGLADFTTADHELFQEVRPNSLGDLCIWQGVYSAYCSLSKGPLGENGLARYVSPEGFLHRGVAPHGAPWFTVDPSKVYQDDGSWVTRDDASLDSLLGFLFGVAMASRTKRMTPALCGAMKRLASRFVADGYRLKNPDGSFTTYGDCRPGVVQAPVRNLAATLVAYWGEACGAPTPGWRDICKSYGGEFSRTETHVLWKHAWYNDHLAMLATCAGFMADAAWFSGCRAGLDVLLTKHAKAGNAFLIFMDDYLEPNSISPGKRARLDNANLVLLEFSDTMAPNGKRAGTVKNEGYPAFMWGGQRMARQPVPAWRRPPADYFWQRNPYSLEGSSSENYSGLDFLLAYTLRQEAKK